MISCFIFGHNPMYSFVHAGVNYRYCFNCRRIYSPHKTFYRPPYALVLESNIALELLKARVTSDFYKRLESGSAALTPQRHTNPHLTLVRSDDEKT